MAGLKFTLELRNDGSRVIGVDAGDIVCRDKVEWARGCLSAFIGAGGVLPQVEVGERLCLPGPGGVGSGHCEEVGKEHVFPCSGYQTGVCVTCCGLGRAGEGFDSLAIDGRTGGFGGLCGEHGRVVDAKNAGVGVESGALEGEVGKVVGKHNASNRRKREKGRARRLAQRAGAGGFEGKVSSSCGSSLSVTGGVGDACDGGPLSAGGGVGSAAGGFQRVDLECVTTVAERRELARGWYERKKTENELAVQRNKYNVKRNEFLVRSRISEKRWEQERLTCEQKLANITEARFGSKPGYAETLASLSDGSELPPSLSTGTDSPASLSDGTISPNSSMSVAEVKKMERKFESKLQEMSEKMIRLELENKTFRASTSFSGGKAVLEGDKVHVYDGTGQYVLPSPECLTEDCAGSMDDYPEELRHYSGDY